MAKFRTERIGDSIQQVLAEALIGFRDPRLQFVTITEVRVTGDLKYSKVYWTVPSLAFKSSVRKTDKEASSMAPAESGETLAGQDAQAFPEKADVEQVGKALVKAQGALRASIARAMPNLRIIPLLQFVYDDSAVYATKIDSLLDKVRH